MRIFGASKKMRLDTRRSQAIGSLSSNTELIDLFRKHELENDVDSYQIYGISLWPLVKSLVGLRMHPLCQKGHAWKDLRVMRAFENLIKCIRRYEISDQNCFLANLEDNHRAVDILFLTPSNRRVLRDGTYYEIYTDPLRSIFSSLGIKSLVFETGRVLEPQFSESYKISDYISHAARYVSEGRQPLPEPDWYAKLSAFLFGVIQETVSWEEFSVVALDVIDRSKVFGRLFEKISPKVLMVVCWYDPTTMAAILAAKRAGILVVDIQHGIQGREHFGYAGWDQIPRAGYEMMPEVFWVWGQRAARDLGVYNAAFVNNVQILVGGNQWLNEFRKSCLPAATERIKTGRTILVTLQADVSPILLGAIDQSPEDWQWKIRFHPSRSMSDRRRDRALFPKRHAGSVDFELANSSLLYDLIRASDIHVTETSTCALEAMAFGVSTIILADTYYGSLGISSYSEYVSNGVMSIARSVDDLLNGVASAITTCGESCASKDYFAGSSEGINAAVRLLDLCRS